MRPSIGKYFYCTCNRCRASFIRGDIPANGRIIKIQEERWSKRIFYIKSINNKNEIYNINMLYEDIKNLKVYNKRRKYRWARDFGQFLEYLKVETL